MKKNHLLLFLSCFYFCVGFAQAIKDTTEKTIIIAQPAPSVRKIKNITLFNDSLNEALLGKKIKVEFDPDFSDNFDEPYILYVNGVPLKGIKPINKNASKKEMIFKLLRTKDDDDLLNSYYSLGSPYKQVEISIGNEQGNITDTKTFTIVLYNPWVLGIGCFLILLFLITFFYLNHHHPIIKDESPLDQKSKPYSLSRTQLAWWSIVIISSFIFLICVTGELFTITGSAVILLGISAATSAAGKIIDNSDKKASGDRHQDRPSQGFFIDILSDDHGVSIHRFQSVAFNIVIGLYFLYQVIANLRMPEIDGSLLTLMGISSGTYAILKASENKSTVTNTTVPTSTPSTDTLFIKKDEDDNAKGKEDDNNEITPVG